MYLSGGGFQDKGRLKRGDSRKGRLGGSMLLLICVHILNSLVQPKYGNGSVAMQMKEWEADRTR